MERQNPSAGGNLDHEFAAPKTVAHAGNIYTRKVFGMLRQPVYWEVLL